MNRSLRYGVVVGVLLVGLMVRVSPAETIGNSLVDRATTDGAVGGIFVLDDPFTSSGVLTDWGLYDYRTMTGKQITPLLFVQDGANYKITGIGTTRLVEGIGEQTFDFDLVAGSGSVEAGTFLGWKDGSNGTNNTGVPEWSAGGSVAYLGGGKTSFAVGDSLPVAASLARTYSMQATTVDGLGGPVETIGNPLTDRGTIDTAVGAMFVMTGNAFTSSGQIDQWSFFNNNDLPTPPAEKWITPLILKEEGGSFVISGIGRSYLSTAGGEQNYAFELWEGTNQVGPGYYFAWKDGRVGVNNNGVAEFDDLTTDNILYFGDNKTTFALGDNLGAGTAYSRTYSLQAQALPGAAMVTVAHGQTLLDRGTLDGWYATIILNDPLPISDAGNVGQMIRWEFFNNDAAGAGRQITPLLVEKVGADYVVRGVGSTQTVTAAGVQMYDFDLVAGTDTFDPTAGEFLIGVRYGGSDTPGQGGIEWNSATGNSWAVFGGPAVGDAYPIVVDGAIGGSLSYTNLARDYSVNFIASYVPEPSGLILAALAAVAMAGVGLCRRRGDA